MSPLCITQHQLGSTSEILTFFWAEVDDYWAVY